MPHGLTWWTPPELLVAPATRAGNPAGYYNLGLGPGMPAVIAALAMAVRAGVARDRATYLLDGAVRWLQSVRREGHDGSQFAYAIPKGTIEGDNDCRAAWCYGDPGIAVSLLLAARAIENPAWEEMALDVAGCAVSRDPDKVGVVDAGFCHGAVGLAHIYNRIYQATNAPTFHDAALAWYDRTLAMRKPGQGIAGFLAWKHRELEGPMIWTSDASFLTGAIGIALALLAGIDVHEPNWDRVLMTNVAPR
jgi:hypothetical protein